MNIPKGFISEIFQSIQGEGIHLGNRQVFVRFSGCNLSCYYCDTETTAKVNDSKYQKTEETPCLLKFDDGIKKIPNPVTLEDAVNAVNTLAHKKDLFHSVSFTGGEPLLQVDFMKSMFKDIKLKKYLETNGTLPDHLNEIINEIDYIAMDFKLPSATKCAPYFTEHKKFLEIAAYKEVFVKAVFSSETKVMEIDEMVTIIADIDKTIPLVLQPVSSHKGAKYTATKEQMIVFQSLAKRKLDKVLVIPQTHKMMGID